MAAQRITDVRTETKVLTDILNSNKEYGKFVDLDAKGSYNESVRGYADTLQIFFDPRRYKVCVNDKILDVLGRDETLDLGNSLKANYTFYDSWNNKNCFTFPFNAQTEADAGNRMIEFVSLLNDCYNSLFEAVVGKQAEEKPAEEKKEEAPKKQRRSRKRTKQTA